MKKISASFLLLSLFSSLSWGHSMSPDKLELISTTDSNTITTFKLENRYKEGSVFEMEAFKRDPGVLGKENAPQTDMIKFSPRDMKMGPSTKGTFQVLFDRDKSASSTKKEEFWICSVRLPAPAGKGPVFKTGMKTRICSKLDIIKK